MIDIMSQHVARLRAGCVFALLVALAGCGGASERGALQESPAAQDPPAPTEDSPAAAVEDEPAAVEDEPAAVEDEPAAAPEDPPAPAAEPIAVGELRGRHGFDWLHPESTKCKELGKAFVAKLEKAKATCQERAPGESFGVDVGAWHSCAAGDQEWLIFPTRKICVEVFETMMANAE